MASAPEPKVSKGAMFGLKLGCAGVAGIIGCSAVFPLDMAKTRLQNQKVGPDGKKLYSGMINCIRTIIRTEGVSGLYKGLVPNLVGIVPEKAIKLGANDFFREMLADGNGKVSLRNGALAGALAGFFQCVATNPMEIVKIRMQVASLSGNPTTPMNIVSELGPRGLYKGAAATLGRDIPFSIIFFSSYGELQDKWATNPDGTQDFTKILISGLLAGAGSAAVTTPIDVVKTRLQIEGAVHTSVGPCVKDILKNEGAPALFKGVGPRMSIIGPLFGIALVSYEVQKWLMKDVLHWV
jgi:hypothetical protein